MQGPHSGEIDIATASARFIGESNFDYAGYDIGFADVNGDGIDDAIIGAYGHDGGGNASGGAYVVQGPISGDLDLYYAEGKYKGEGSFTLPARAYLAPVTSTATALKMSWWVQLVKTALPHRLVPPMLSLVRQKP